MEERRCRHVGVMTSFVSGLLKLKREEEEGKMPS